MSKLCITLPPFAPDYSGAASALFDMGGLVVIHDASGCTGNYTGFDEPRWFGSASAVFCSGLRHMDAVLGNDDKLIKQVVKASESLDPKFIAILGSPVPMVVGTDYKGIASEIEVQTGIPSMGIDTRGLSYYGKGIQEAGLAVMKKFIAHNAAKIPGTVNLLGVTPLDFYINSNRDDFIRLFEENGMKVTACYFMGMSVEDLQPSVSASLNVAVSQSGIAIAKYMERRYGIPYITGTPIGDGKNLLEKAQAALEGRDLSFVPETGEAAALIAGEQVISNSIREYLQNRLGYGPVCVASLYDTESKEQAKGDVTVRDEHQLRELLNSGRYKTVIADPMVRQLIRRDDISFYPFAHVALSSKLHWEECRRLVGREMEEWLSTIK
ncbi:nitrogenase component 1 [Lachnospiraceae bacterium 54-53]